LSDVSETKNVVVSVSLAFALWYIVFLTNILSSFWYRVTVASIILALYAGIFGSGVAGGDHDISVSEVLRGVISGGFLYASSPLYVAGLLLIITSFCEEFFWRRYLQTVLVESHGGIGFTLSVLLYAFIHLPTGNLALVFAALIAGLFWGLLYDYTESFWVVVFSHIVWTELIFMLLPLR